jgi:hypothetical protein
MAPFLKTATLRPCSVMPFSGLQVNDQFTPDHTEGDIQ